MTSWLQAVGYWLIDYYFAATILMAVVCLALLVIKQPVRRIAVVWGASAGLVALAVLCAFPAWPRVALFESTASSSLAVVPSEPDLPAAPMVPTIAPPVVQPIVRTPIVASVPQLRVPRPSTAIAAATPAHQAPGSAAAPPTMTAKESKAARASVDWSSIVAMIPWQPIGWTALAAFLSGSLLVGSRVLHGVWCAASICRKASAPPSELVHQLREVVGTNSPKPRLLMSVDYPVPIATGTIRPTILLPRPFVELGNERDRKSVLAHEWAHIRNGDLWLLALDRWLTPLLWAHPLYSWMRRTIRADQELLADALAATHSTPVDYAEMLVTWARRIAAERQVRPAMNFLGVWEAPSRLADRVSSLLRRSRAVELHCTRSWRMGSLIALVTVPILLSLITLRPETTRAGAQRRVTLPGVIPAATSASLPPATMEAADLRRQADVERDVIDLIRKSGGGVRVEPFGSARLATEVNMVYRVTENGVRVDNTQPSSEAVAAVARLRSLRSLALTGKQVTTPALERLASLPNLRRLCLWNVEGFTPEAASATARIPGLLHLELQGAGPGDAIAERLCQVLSLEQLSIQIDGLSAAGISQLMRLPNLKTLSIDLGEAPLGEAALASLGEGVQLEKLGLAGTNLGDTHLVSLEPLKSLRVLAIGESRVSGWAIGALRRELPELYVLLPGQTLPPLASMSKDVECPISSHRQEAVLDVMRKFAKRIRDNDPEAAALWMSHSETGSLQIADLPVDPLENVGWSVAYGDSKSGLALSGEFTDAFGAEHVYAAEVTCAPAGLRIERIAAVPTGRGIDGAVHAYVARHPGAQPIDGFMPVTKR